MKLRLAVGGAVLAALVCAASAAAFTPSNPFYTRQWYLAQDHAFDAWTAPPSLVPVKVAVVDSGIDCTLPDFQGRIFATASFVGGNACTDQEGHGTIVAGEIAADLDTDGIVGIAYSAQLLVAKVVAPDGTIPIDAEASAIRWAASEGARVINLSFGAVRDPADPSLDAYSQKEADAVAYAQRKGALVVAAVGNADEAYATPWNYASWPAALPHVIGVAALTHSGNVPDFSDRDPTYVDLAAPGVDIFSTFPAALTAKQNGCWPQGYTECASGAYYHPEGTSFAAPQVSAAAAVLFGINPALTASQVGWILERTADDVNASTGCTACVAGRDRYSGWGSLDVASAVAVAMGASGGYPPPDRYEPNDTIAEAPLLSGAKLNFQATLDYWDDPTDIYRLRLKQGATLQASMHAKWKGALVLMTLLNASGGTLLGQASAAGVAQSFAYRARKAGVFYVELQDQQGAGAYLLRLQTTPPAKPKT
ncbi:MAG TPA: S8 family serine peptidase [Gaiellaceae bacterium]|nr:S8 family serine peptidase [Gaiellaceae bacterium]